MTMHHSSLSSACQSIFSQLASVTGQLRQEHFVQPVAVLSGATIGQHLRHTLEFFLCLEQGAETGLVSYDNRTHDQTLETNLEKALAVIDEIQAFYTVSQTCTPLQLEVNYGRQGSETIRTETNLCREIMYNIEHAIHHMALIKIGIRALAPYVEIPEGFGVAVSTLRYKDTLSN